MFLENVNWFSLIHEWDIFNDKLIAGAVAKAIKEDIGSVEGFWLDNPDLRISQVLIALDFIPNSTGIWYYTEDHTILLNQGVHPKKILMWTSVYDKEMNRLEKPIRKFLFELASDHIQAILDGEFTDSPLFIKTFKEILKEREDG
jgi:hypothetical protein